MIVLLDEPVPHKLRTAIQNHDVSTTVYRGWGGLKNGALLATADRAGVQVFITCDQEIPDQQNLAGRAFGVIVLSKQDWPLIQTRLKLIQAAVDTCLAGTVVVIDCSR